MAAVYMSPFCGSLELHVVCDESGRALNQLVQEERNHRDQRRVDQDNPVVEERAGCGLFIGERPMFCCDIQGSAGFPAGVRG